MTFFELDASRNHRQVSDKISIAFTVNNGQAPLLNLPSNESEIDARYGQNFSFAWTPRGTSLSGAGGLTYNFSLWELGEDENPYDVAEGKTPIYTSSVSVPMLAYDPTKPLLQVGKHYAWQVQVVDPFGNNVYENNGKSEVWEFRYGLKCQAPALNFKSIGSGYTEIYWDKINQAQNYDLRWRIQGTNEYSHYITLGNYHRLAFQKNQVYDVEIQSQCYGGEYSDWKSSKYPENTTPMLTPAAPVVVYTREEAINPADIPVNGADVDPTVYDNLVNTLNAEPKSEIRCGKVNQTAVFACQPDDVSDYQGTKDFTSKPNGTFYVNGYDVRITKVVNQTSGEGLLYMPLFGQRIPVVWSGITLKEGEGKDYMGNAYGCLTSGEVIVAGSNPNLIVGDLNTQYQALYNSLNSPGSYSGTFGQAIEAMKAKAQELIDKISQKQTPTEEELKNFKSICKAVKKGIAAWEDDLNKEFGKDTKNTYILQLKKDLLANSKKLQDLLDCDKVGYSPIKRKSNELPALYASAQKGLLGTSISLVSLLAPCHIEDAAPMAELMTNGFNEIEKIKNNKLDLGDNTGYYVMTIYDDPEKNVYITNDAKKFYFTNGAKLVEKSTQNVIRVEINGVVEEYVPMYHVEKEGDKYVQKGFAIFYKKAYLDNPPSCTNTIGYNIKSLKSTPACNDGILDPKYYTQSHTGNKFYEDIRLNASLADANKDLVNQIDDLVEELLSFSVYRELLQTPIKQKGVNKLTVADLQRIKKLLEDYKATMPSGIETSTDLRLSHISQLWDIIKSCWNSAPNDNSACNVSPGILPRCLWDNSDATNIVLNEAGLVAGAIDGAAEMVKGLYDVIEFSTCWANPLLITDDCSATRSQTISAMKQIGDLKNKVGWTGLGSQLGSTLGTEFNDWLTQIVALEPNLNVNCRSYQMGKLIFNVGSLFIGAGEINAGVRATSLMDKVIQSMGSVKKLSRLFDKTKQIAVGLGKVAQTVANNVATRRLPLLLDGVEIAGAVIYQGLNQSIHLGFRVSGSRALLETERLLFKAAPKLEELGEIGIKVGDDLLEDGAMVVKEIEDAGKTKRLFGKMLPKPTGDGTIFKPIALVGMTGKLVDEIVKITDDGIDEPECTICLARKPSISLCRKLEQLATRGANRSAVEDKLCSNISDAKQLESVVTKLLMLQDSEIKAFLGDITNTSVCSSGGCLANNVSNLTVNLIDAWKIVYDGRCAGVTNCNENVRKDWAVLFQVNSMYQDNAVLTALGNRAGLVEIIQKNERTPCNTCGSGGASYLNKMDVYLKDVEYFVENYQGISGWNTVIGSQGIKNGGVNQVEATAFMLRVLHENPVEFESQVSGFEVSTGVGKRKMDIQKHSGTNVECKSWDDNADTFADFVAGTSNSYQQFLAYLQVAPDLSKLEYWLDGKKLSGSDKLQTAKLKFQTLFQNKAIEIFREPINGGIGLAKCQQLFQIIDISDFLNKVSNTSSSIYSFIKIK
ncbi:hypothetical protein [Flectobacillus longus]|uniref:hypothetical protein n=1 Tax=Flectobacillus longus TaxID=2984207 RepID=UPI0024B672BC|nr:hypothetical protein [Flectobacillus longus]MDI9880168.1 hypothetical protein [Flectobacillus longus]